MPTIAIAETTTITRTTILITATDAMDSEALIQVSILMAMVWALMEWATAWALMEWGTVWAPMEWATEWVTTAWVWEWATGCQ